MTIHHVAYLVITPQPSIEPVTHTLGAQHLNHRTTREVSENTFQLAYFALNLPVTPAPESEVFSLNILGLQKKDN